MEKRHRVLIIISFLTAATILLLNGHAVAGGWCIAGAILCS